MPRQAKPLTDTEIRALKPKSDRYRIADGGGLLLEVMPTGNKVWRYRYTLGGKQYPALTIGPYPAIDLKSARRQRDEWAVLVANGKSPADTVRATKVAATVEGFAEYWFAEQVSNQSEGYRLTMRRALTKDVFPLIGARKLTDITPADVLLICDKIKARSAPSMALATRNALRRMYDFAIARQVAQFNPASAVVARFIATQKSRERVLALSEIGTVMRCVYQSDIRRALKLCLHLLFITLARKSELIEARWDEFDLDGREWNIPAERMKKDKPHRVYLSEQAVSMLEELKTLAGSSAYVFPSVRGYDDRPISKSTLNQTVRGLDMAVQHFVLHDFRRTASTHLHEMGYSTDAIEKALAHETKGIRGVYNRAEYAEQRKNILGAWASLVEAQLSGSNIVTFRGLAA